MSVGCSAGKVLYCTDVIHQPCISTVLWDTKHIKQFLIIWVDVGKLVSCVFNAKYCLSSACTISFYHLVICDFALLPDTEICDESLMKPFCVIASSHACQRHGAEGKCRRRECNTMIGPKIWLVYHPLRAVTLRSPLIYLPKNVRQPQGKMGMVLHGKSWIVIFQNIFPGSSCARDRTAYCCHLQWKTRIKTDRRVTPFPFYIHPRATFSIFSQVAT